MTTFVSTTKGRSQLRNICRQFGHAGCACSNRPIGPHHWPLVRGLLPHSMCWRALAAVPNLPLLQGPASCLHAVGAGLLQASSLASAFRLLGSLHMHTSQRILGLPLVRLSTLPKQMLWAGTQGPCLRADATVPAPENRVGAIPCRGAWGRPSRPYPAPSSWQAQAAAPRPARRGRPARSCLQSPARWRSPSCTGAGSPRTPAAGSGRAPSWIPTHSNKALRHPSCILTHETTANHHGPPQVKRGQR